MDKNFLEKLESHVSVIKNAETGKDANDKLVKTVKLLLTQIDRSETCLAGYNEKEIMLFFSSIGQFAQSACDFYLASRERLDPEALNKTIRERLETVTQEIIKVNALIESIEENDAELLKREKELNKINEKYKAIKKTVDDLRAIKENISNEDIIALKSKERELNETIKENQKICDNLKREIKDLTSTHERENKELENTRLTLSKTEARVNAEKQIIEEDIISTISEKRDIIETIYNKHSKDLRDTETNIENFKTQFEQLKDRLEEAKTEYEIYNAHFGENSNIVKKLKEYGVSRVGDFFIETKRLEESFKTELDRFDELIRDVIVEQEKIKEDIGGRNGTLN